MPFFASSSPFDGDVEKATHEMNTTEDWALIMDICDKVVRSNGSKDCLKSIVKRVHHKVPYVSMQALTLFDACISNCGTPFHLEVASRDFVSECRTIIGKGHPKVAQRLKQLIKKWAENEFKSDAALNLIPSLYNSLKADGHSFATDDLPKSSITTTTRDPNVSSQQEEEDIAKAIALSLKEDKKGSSKAQSLYPAFNNSSSSSPSSTMPSANSSDVRRVRALYDFEAAEDNELTFKTGEFINVIDDSDPNWWKGSNFRGEGLFPANFVSADLTAEPESMKKTVKFNEEVEVKTMEPVPEVVEIDEDRIDKTLTMLQNADPTGETAPDPPDMVPMEEQCKAMNPLIDQELEKIDRKHMTLMELNSKVIDALQMYHNLMKELPGYGYTGLKMGQPQFQPGTLPQQAYNGQPGFPVQPEMAAAMPAQVQAGMLPPGQFMQGQGQAVGMSATSLPPQAHSNMMPPATATASMPYTVNNSAPNSVGQMTQANTYMGQPPGPADIPVNSTAPNSIPSQDPSSTSHGMPPVQNASYNPMSATQQPIYSNPPSQQPQLL